MRSTRAAALAAAACLAWASTAQASVLSDNLAAPWGGDEFISSNSWVAASFGTDAQAYNLTSVALEAWGSSWSGVRVDIYTSVGAGVGQPGALIGSLTTPDSPSGSPVTFTANGIVLSASTTYWVVMRTMGPGQSSHWTYTWSDEGSGVGFQHSYGSSGDGGGTWATFDTAPQKMKVNAQPVPWLDLGSALPGVSGASQLDATGTLGIGTSGSLQLSSAAPGVLALLFLSTTSTPMPFKGGTLLPVPVLLPLPLATDSAGSIQVPWSSWPAGLSGLSLFLQCAIQDSAAVKDVALSNALRADVP